MILLKYFLGGLCIKFGDGHGMLYGCVVQYCIRRVEGSRLVLVSVAHTMWTPHSVDLAGG